MYESRFGLHRKPFPPVLEDSGVFRTEESDDLRDSLLHALRSDLGVAVLTGPAGIGKSVTLLDLQRTLSATGVAVLLRGGTLKSSSDLYFQLHQHILKHTDKVSKADPQQAIRVERSLLLDHLQRVAEFWGPTRLLIDDAHATGEEVFQELRNLLDEKCEGQNLLKVLIAGNLSLEEKLNRPALVDFSQRIRCHRFVERLTSAESVKYLQHQLQRVGGDMDQLFDVRATEQVIGAADGVPRCIDLLADECLVVADRKDKSIVDSDIVAKALKHLQHLPYSWNVSATEDTCESDSQQKSVCETVVGNGVVEIGHFADSDRPVNLTSGVVEIGGDSNAEESVAAEPVDTESVATETADFEFGEDADDDRSLIQEDASNNDNMDLESEYDVVDDEDLEEPVDTIDARPVSREELLAESGLTAGILGVGAAASLTGDNRPTAEVDVETCDACETDEESLAIGAAADDKDAAVVVDTFVVEDDLNTVETDDAPTTFQGFHRWQPAGSWPSQPVVVTRGTSPDFSDFSTPVVDRFTWNELGRPVQQQPNEQAVPDVHDQAPSWPPTNHGVAPEDTIPTQPMDEQFSAMLEDLGAIMQTTSEARDRVDTDLPSPIRLSDTRYETPLHTGPVNAIDEIEQLIKQDDSSEMDSTAESPATDSINIADLPPARFHVRGDDYPAADTEPTELAMFSSDQAHAAVSKEEEESSLQDKPATEKATDEELTSEGNGNDPNGDGASLFSLPISVDSIEFDSRIAGTGGTEELEGEDEFGIKYQLIPINRDASEVDEITQLSVSLSDETAISETDIEADSEEADRLGIQVHRLQFANVSSLRKAAGAESLAAPVPEAAEQVPEGPVDTCSDQAADSTPRPRKDFGFSTLFTRLRSKR